MKTKRVRIIVDNKYVDVTIEFDEDDIGEEDEIIAGFAFDTAYALGVIKVEIKDVANEEHCHTKTRLQ